MTFEPWIKAGDHGHETEHWEVQDIAPTLNAFDQHESRTPVLITQPMAFHWQANTDEISLSEDAAALSTLRVEALLISSTEDSPARTYQWQASGPVLGASVAVSGLSSSASCPSCGHDGQLLRMSPDFYPATADATLESFSTGWKTSGIASGGRYWTLNTSESRSAAAACSLSQVLQDEVSSKFYLSAKAAAGILRRAERRGKMLPAHLAEALLTVAGDTETTSTATEPLSLL